MDISSTTLKEKILYTTLALRRFACVVIRSSLWNGSRTSAGGYNRVKDLLELIWNKMEIAH